MKGSGDIWKKGCPMILERSQGGQDQGDRPPARSPGDAGSPVWRRLLFRTPQGHAPSRSPRDPSLGQQHPLLDPKHLEAPRPGRLDRPGTRRPARVGGRGAGRPRGRPYRPLPPGLPGPTRTSPYLGGRHGGAATAARLAQASLARRPLGGYSLLLSSASGAGVSRPSALPSAPRPEP